MNIQREESKDEHFWANKKKGYLVRFSNRPQGNNHLCMDINNDGKKLCAIYSKFENGELRFASTDGWKSWDELLADLKLIDATDYTKQVQNVVPAVADPTTTTATAEAVAANPEQQLRQEQQLPRQPVLPLRLKLSAKMRKKTMWNKGRQRKEAAKIP
jgi:hypothetical protein